MALPIITSAAVAFGDTGVAVLAAGAAFFLVSSASGVALLPREIHRAS